MWKTTHAVAEPAVVPWDSRSTSYLLAIDAGTDPNNDDSDGDGFDDHFEVHAGADLLVPLSLPPPVPALSPPQLLLLAGLLLLGGFLASRAAVPRPS